jgi:hypothetical protein
MTQGIDYSPCRALARKGESRKALMCYLALALTKYGVGKDDDVRKTNGIMDMAERLDRECPDFVLSKELPESVGVQKVYTFESALLLFDTAENEELEDHGYAVRAVLSDKFERLLKG